MRVDRIQPQDLVKLRAKDRVVYGELLEVADRIVHFRPLSPAAGWHHATARQVVGHLAQGQTTNKQQDDKPTPTGITIPPTATSPESRPVTHDPHGSRLVTRAPGAPQRHYRRLHGLLRSWFVGALEPAARDVGT
jgi:hypothetical protein